jgi:3'-phosphoadenosine 5'-phosphosulfate sulfotransferase (PAPS reductase)/FAD synthetase
MSKALIAHSQQLIGRARTLGCDRLAVEVSSGKDSTCLMDMVVRSGIPAVFIYQYIIPGWRLDEEVLEKLEDRYKVEIVRVAHPRRGEMFATDTLCINRVWDATAARAFTHNDAMDRFIAALSKTKWLATGIRKSDSITRTLALNKYPNPNPGKKRVYHLADWKTSDVWAHIKAEGLPISRAYALFNRSLSTFNVKHMYPLRMAAPDDYARFMKDFPLIEPLCWLYEKRARETGVLSLPEC